jgi:hypothetical protein
MLGSNCLLYEADGGPDVNIGTTDSPLMVSHAEFTQLDYAKYAVLYFDVDVDRLRATAAECQTIARSRHGDDSGRAREYARAADLCERAAKIILDFGAAGDEVNRRRLVAICKHDTSVATLGGVPGFAQMARENFEEALVEIDAQAPADELPEKIPYRGPSYDASTGRFAMGEIAGGGQAYWTLNQPGVGMANGLIVGPPEIGKTSSLRLVLMEAVQEPKFVIWLADPTGRHFGEDAWKKVDAKIARDPKQVRDLLREAVRVIDSRQKHGRFPDPTPQRPGIVFALEEAHELLADDLEATQLAERIATEGGAVSVALVVTAPSTDLENFGGSLALRSALAAVNAFPMGPNGPYMLDELRSARR